MTEYKHLLTPRDAADYIGVTIGTLAVWRCTHRYAISYIKVGGGPKFRKFGTMRVIYKIEDLDEWIERRLSKTFSSTGIPCGGDDA